MQKKFSTIREKQTQNLQNGSGPSLQAVRGSACALLRGPNEKKKKNNPGLRFWGDTDPQKRISLREVSAAIPVLSAGGSGAIVSVLRIL